MGLFDFLKPKSSKSEEMLARMRAKLFPKGEKDINAVTDAVLLIFNNITSRDEAQNIALKSVFISNWETPFELQHLKQHLSGYPSHRFTDQQVQEFYIYLGILRIATELMRKTPSEVVHDGNDWKVLD